MNRPDAIERRLCELRAELDAAFAEPAGEGEGAERVPILAIRVGGQPLAIRVREVAGLLALREVVPIRSRAHGLIGIAGLRGRIVPVFSLARLLRRVEKQAERLAILRGVESPVAFAFAELEGVVEVPAGQIRSVSEKASTEAWHDGSVVRAVIDLDAALGAGNERT